MATNRKATYKKYNKKRTSDTLDTAVIKIPGITYKKVKSRDGSVSYRYLNNGKAISYNTARKLAGEIKSEREYFKEYTRKDLEKQIGKETYRATKIRERLFNEDFDSVEEFIAKRKITLMRRTITITKNRLEGLRKSIDAITFNSRLFTEEQKELMNLHAQNFNKLTSGGETENFWQFYNEIAGMDPSVRYSAETDLDFIKIKQMFEMQLGRAYTQKFLPFLYN